MKIAKALGIFGWNGFNSSHDLSVSSLLRVFTILYQVTVLRLCSTRMHIRQAFIIILSLWHILISTIKNGFILTAYNFLWKLRHLRYRRTIWYWFFCSIMKLGNYYFVYVAALVFNEELQTCDWAANVNPPCGTNKP